MAKVKFSLVEQNSDVRSSDKAYEFRIDNQDASAISLLSITPRIPEGVELVEVKNPSLLAVKARYSNLCEELTIILKRQQFISYKALRDQIAQVNADYWNETTSKFSSFLGQAISFTLGLKKSRQRELSARMNQEFSSFFYVIENKSHGEIALAKLLEDESVSKSIKETFELKVKQLIELDKKLGSDFESSSLATIEPESFYAVTYILKFPRSYIDSRRFNISIEGSFSKSASAERHVGGATASVIISPKPYILSLIAIASSLLGLTLKTNIDVSVPEKNLDFYTQMQQAFTQGPVLSSAILALVFFNVYEFTDLGRNLKLNIGWRSALLIGILCGLLGDRILFALKALIGAN